MKKPTAPKKPKWPTKPLPYLPARNRHLYVDEGDSISAAAKHANAPFDELFLDDVEDGCACFTWVEKGQSNPNFEKQTVEYWEKMKQYQEDLALFDMRFKNYEIELRQWLEHHYEEKLKKLRG